MSINSLWHKDNKMPKNANIAQRIKWHLEHQKFCNCREIPAKLLAEIKKARLS